MKRHARPAARGRLGWVSTCALVPGTDAWAVSSNRLASLFPGKCARTFPAHAFGSRPGPSHIARRPYQSPLGLFSPLARLQRLPASRVAAAAASPASILTFSGSPVEGSRRSAAVAEVACPARRGVAPGEPPDLALSLCLFFECAPWERSSPRGLSGGGGRLPGLLSGIGGSTARGSSCMSGRPPPCTSFSARTSSSAHRTNQIIQPMASLLVETHMSDMELRLCTSGPNHSRRGAPLRMRGPFC